MGYAGLSPGDPQAIGPYRLYGELGCGGMGRVFLGLSADKQPVAVKVIRAELAADREFRTRFRQEVAAARKVNGRFTAQVVDADLDGPVPWLATAYVAGPALAEAVNSHGPLPVDKVLWLAAGLAESLIAIHAADVVHRDLKPSNVLLAEDGPRVIDFGISQAAWEIPIPGADFGSPGFMSPEHALGQVVGPPSDIFSLGAVVTFAATGQRPFGSGSSAALIYRLVNSPAVLDTVPAELRGLVGSCLAKHPDDRPTASSLLTQVGAIQPSPGWLAESIIASLAQDRSVAGFAGGAGSLLALTGAASGQPQPGRGGRSGRHRISRSLASACLSRRPGGGLGRGGLRPDRRRPHAAHPGHPAAGRSGSGGDFALLGVEHASLPPGFVICLTPGLARAERLPDPVPVHPPPVPLPVPLPVPDADGGYLFVCAADPVLEPEQVLGVLVGGLFACGLFACGLFACGVLAWVRLRPLRLRPLRLRPLRLRRPRLRRPRLRRPRLRRPRLRRPRLRRPRLRRPRLRPLRLRRPRPPRAPPRLRLARDTPPRRLACRAFRADYSVDRCRRRAVPLHGAARPFGPHDAQPG